MLFEFREAQPAIALAECLALRERKVRAVKDVE